MCKHLERRHLLTRIGVKGPLKPKNQRESCIRINANHASDAEQ